MTQPLLVHRSILWRCIYQYTSARDGMYLFYLVFIIFKAIVSLSGQEVTAALSFWPPSWDSRQEGSAGWAESL